MLDAVLFDWGDTLFHFAYDEELLAAGWAAGLGAIGTKGLPDHEEAALAFRDRFFPRIFAPDRLEEVEYPALIRELLGEFEVEVTDEELHAFLDAEHEAWKPARSLGADTHALLESLRALGLKLGLVSNAFDPGWLLHRDLAQMDLADRLDAAVFSSEVGVRKPHPAIFEAALDLLAVEPERALFVGDRRYEDILGSRELGMGTVLALWFRADEDDRGADPDYEAHTQMEILTIVRRLLDEA